MLKSAISIDNCAAAEDSRALGDLFTRRETVDAWQHERMLNYLRPLISAYPDAHWLTIGDEAADGWILRNCGVKNVTSSSLMDLRLKRAKELGYLEDIEVLALNAEHLELADACFDFILCSQAYHHLRRPPLGFYEFMRVARIGFVLIEPTGYSHRPLDALTTVTKMILRKRRPIYDLFEPAGNYVYRVSEWDISRLLAALQMPWFAIKTFNNFNNAWLASQRRDALLPRLIFQLAIGVQEVLSSCRLISPGLCVIFVPVGGDVEPAREILTRAKFRIVRVPSSIHLAEALSSCHLSLITMAADHSHKEEVVASDTVES